MLPEGYAARPATLADAAGVAAVIASNQLADFGAVEISAAEVLNDWDGVDLEVDTLVIERAGVIGAMADLVVRPGQVSVYGYVHPDHLGLGLGSFLAEWGERRAADQPGPTIVRHYVVSTNRAAVRLFEGRGYEFQRSVLWMERGLVDPLEGPEAVAGGTREQSLPPGLTARTYRGAADEPATYLAFEAASRGMSGRVPNTLEQWLAVVRPKDKELFFLVETDDAAHGTGGEADGEDHAATAGRPGAPEIVGILIASVEQSLDTHVANGDPTGEGSAAQPGPRGHVDSLRVAEQWRRRGIGAALLAQAFAALRERGADRVGLSVDAASPTGAPNLYLAVGMHVTRRYLVMERTFEGDQRLT